MTYGIYDTKDKCWLGTNDTNDGPKTFPDFDIARVAANIAAERLNIVYSRIVAREYDAPTVIKRDELPTVMNTLTALQILEGGSPITNVYTNHLQLTERVENDPHARMVLDAYEAAGLNDMEHHQGDECVFCDQIVAARKKLMEMGIVKPGELVH